VSQTLESAKRIARENCAIVEDVKHALDLLLDHGIAIPDGERLVRAILSANQAGARVTLRHFLEVITQLQ
jgi:hypothetical protein